MDKDIFEIIVKRLTNSDDKTKQVMDIVFGTQLSIHDFERCCAGHFYKKDEVGCPYCNPFFEKYTLCKINNHYYQKRFEKCPYCKEEKKEIVEYETVNSKSVDKKQEIMDSLCYLKSKEKKTNQDKESIYMLEMILRNMK